MRSFKRFFAKRSDPEGYHPNRRAGASWGVASTVKEPLDLIVPFVCYHLALGAGSVTLYLDDPNDPAADVLAGIDGVRLVRCDGDHWRRMGFEEKPDNQNPRQRTNFADALARTEHDWLIHLDADECLWLPDGMGAEISATRDEDWIAVRPAERVWIGSPEARLFGGVFRTPMTRDDFARTYGDSAPFLAPTGTAGYSTHKPIVPARTPYRPTVHALTHGPENNPRPRRTATAAKVLHFEGLTPIHWALKQLRYAALGDPRIVRSTRYAALREIIAAEDVKAAALARYQDTSVITSDWAQALEHKDALLRPDIGIEAAVARFAPGVEIDFTGARINAVLEPMLEAVAADVAKRREALLAVVDPRV